MKIIPDFNIPKDFLRSIVKKKTVSLWTPRDIKVDKSTSSYNNNLKFVLYFTINFIFFIPKKVKKKPKKQTTKMTKQNARTDSLRCVAHNAKEEKDTHAVDILFVHLENKNMFSLSDNRLQF